MASQSSPILSPELITFLQGQRPLVLATENHEGGAPNLSILSWAAAVDEHHIRIVVDNRSRIVSNVRQNEQVSIGVFGPDTCYSISGRARVTVGHVKELPLRLAMIEVDVDTVRDIMFFGAALAQLPEYELTYDRAAAADLDSRVFNVIRSGSENAD